MRLLIEIEMDPVGAVERFVSITNAEIIYYRLSDKARHGGERQGLSIAELMFRCPVDGWP